MILLDEKPNDEITDSGAFADELRASLRRLSKAQALVWHTLSAVEKQKFLRQAAESEPK